MASSSSSIAPAAAEDKTTTTSSSEHAAISPAIRRWKKFLHIFFIWFDAQLCFSSAGNFCKEFKKDFPLLWARFERVKKSLPKWRKIFASSPGRLWSPINNFRSNRCYWVTPAHYYRHHYKHIGRYSRSEHSWSVPDWGAACIVCGSLLNETIHRHGDGRVNHSLDRIGEQLKQAIRKERSAFA